MIPSAMNCNPCRHLKLDNNKRGNRRTGVFFSASYSLDLLSVSLHKHVILVGEPQLFSFHTNSLRNYFLILTSNKIPFL